MIFSSVKKPCSFSVTNSRNFIFQRHYEILAFDSNVLVIFRRLEIVLTISAEIVSIFVELSSCAFNGSLKDDRKLQRYPRQHNSRLRTSRNSRSSTRNLSPVCLNINRIECPFEMRFQIIKGNKLMKRVAIALYCALVRTAACALFIVQQ